MIKDIVFLPKRFYADRNISIYSSLKETGYFESHNQVTEADILETIFQNPECVYLWLQWSEDKRTTSGWYFIQKKHGKYDVGYFPPKENLKTNEYSEIMEACAAFIKLEIEEIRKN